MLLPTHPTRRPTTPRHPFSGAVKNKAWFVLRLCACGRFIHFISISFRRFVHSALLHSLHYPSLHFAYVHFTNLSTAQQKQFLLFIPQSQHTGFPCHGVCLTHATIAFVFWKVTKAANASKQTAHATTSLQPDLLHSVQSLHLLLTHRTIESGMLYFFLRIVYPSQPTKHNSEQYIRLNWNTVDEV